MTSFKSPPMSLLDMAISFMRGIGLVAKDERVVVIPEDKWHAMQERHEADGAALRSALARVVEVETQCARLVADLAVARGQP